MDEQLLRFNQIRDIIKTKDVPINKVSVYQRLTPDQKALLDQMPAALYNFRGLFINAPTGFGKTFLIATIIEWARTHFKCVLFVTASTVQKTKDTMRELGVFDSVVIHKLSNTMTEKIYLHKQEAKTLFIIDEFLTLLNPTNMIDRTWRSLFPTNNHAVVGLSADLCVKNISDLVFLTNYGARIPRDVDEFDSQYRMGDGTYKTEDITRSILPAILVAPKKTMTTAVALDPEVVYIQSPGVSRNYNEVCDRKKWEYIQTLPRPCVIYVNNINILRVYIDSMTDNKPFTLTFLSSTIAESKRQGVLNDFNNTSNPNQILFIGPAVLLGIEILTAVSFVYWNPPTTLQVINQSLGRLLRKDSLMHLEPQYRIVYVYILVGAASDVITTPDLVEFDLFTSKDIKHMIDYNNTLLVKEQVDIILQNVRDITIN